MMRTSVFLVLLLSGLFFSCHHTPAPPAPAVPPEQVLKNTMSFLYYQQQHLRFYGKFTAFDSSLTPVDRSAFFQAIRTGDYLPLRLKTSDSAISYQLYPVPANTASEVKQVLRQTGEEVYANYSREGKKFPAVHLTDLSGKQYDSLALAGKTVVLKCWFIHCVACVKEMPALNQLVAASKNREDLVFLSLAFDTPQQLSAFLQKQPFSYAVIPVTQQFFSDTLGIRSYPTHMIIRDGIIQKVMGNATDLIDALNATAPAAGLSYHTGLRKPS